MISKCIVLTIITTVLLFSAAADTDEESMEKLAGSFFSAYSKGEIKTVVQLFHFPPAQTKQEKNKSIRFITAGMQAFTREMGPAGEYTLTSYQQSSYDFKVFAGSDDYWAEHYNVERKIYKTTFSKADNGYVLFDFCKINNKWEIAFVRFALPESNPKTGPVFRKLNSLILELMDTLSAKERVKK